jgi:hypothetical protein
MKTIAILFFLFGSLIIITSCEKNLAKKYDGNFYFTTKASSYMGDVNNDSTLNFYGTIKADSKHTLKIEYGPRIMPTSSSTLVANIYVDGIISPDVDDNENFTYPDYVAKDLHYVFHGGFNDNGDVNITLGFDGLGAGYTNTIHGTRLQ